MQLDLPACFYLNLMSFSPICLKFSLGHCVVPGCIFYNAQTMCKKLLYEDSNLLVITH